MTQPPLPPEPPEDDATLVRPAARTYEEYEEAAPAPVGPPPDRRVGAGMLLALGALALIALGILVAYLLIHRHHKKAQPTTVIVTTQPATTVASRVTVPHLVGLKEAEALVRLGQLGLKPKEVFQATKKPTRLVVSQNPAEATEVAKGSTVKLVIDQGAPAQPATTTAPATTTVTTTAATTTAPAPTTTTAPSTTTTTPPKTTTTATPPTPKSATVPDVSGQAEQAAVNAFNRAGVLPSLVFVPGSDPLGTVVEQAKPSGTTVPYHSHVQINLSKGPNATTYASVPNAVGQTLKQAVSTLNGAHLRLIYVKFPVTSKTQAGKIVQQTPIAGARAPQNAQILVFVGAFRG